MNTIHLRLRQIRRSRNMSQEELAKRLGISRQAIIALEQGVSLPSLPVIVALLRELNVPFNQLFTDSWNPFRTFTAIDEGDDCNALATYRHSDGSQNIPISLTETPQAFTVLAELAGIREEDLSVDMSAQHILIMAIRKSGQETASTTHLDEIQSGPLMRILSLPSPINTAEAQATYDRGMLTLSLPKLLPETKRRITFKPAHDTLAQPNAPQEETHGSE